MTTDTLTLTDFILQRVAEDEANGRTYLDVFPEGDMAPVFRRTLAECEAKRRIVELHESEGWVCVEDENGVCQDEYESTRCEACFDEMPCPTLRALAAVYADHDDYRDEWRDPS